MTAYPEVHHPVKLGSNATVVRTLPSIEMGLPPAAPELETGLAFCAGCGERIARCRCRGGVVRFRRFGNIIALFPNPPTPGAPAMRAA